eukprot:1161207-Pelagomonas_calceolata.AAC.7
MAPASLTSGRQEFGGRNELDTGPKISPSLEDHNISLLQLERRVHSLITRPAMAVRGSASAPYYFDDFVIGEDRFQDGATVANNPAVIALQQMSPWWRAQQKFSAKKRMVGRGRCA